MLLPNSENPWLVLIPREEAIKEWHELSREKQQQLSDEISFCSKNLENNYSPDKLNIGSLGNIVPQLHIHIIARFKDDKAWPNSLWGIELALDKGIVDKWVLGLKKSVKDRTD